MIHTSSFLSLHFSGTKMSVINLTLWLREWMKKAVFHQLTLSCAVTLTDNKLLDPHTAFHAFIPWLEPTACSPSTLLSFLLRSGKINKITQPLWVTTFRLAVGHYFFAKLSNCNTNHFIHKGANTSPQHCSDLLPLEGKHIKKPWQCIRANWEQMDSHSMASKVNKEV